MSRTALTQTQRTQHNPLMLGSFDSTAVRYLRGSLGPKNQLTGYADTWDQSRGGFGGGTYNHWFKLTITNPGWILIANDSPRPNYIQFSAYDLNRTPIESRAIIDEDSIKVQNGDEVYYPFLNDIAGSQVSLYNVFFAFRLDKGDSRYYPLTEGSYLICVSSTRNEPIDYAFALVVEFPSTEGYFQLEDFDGSLFLTEDGDKILLDPAGEFYFESNHDHSLSEWEQAWSSSHQDTQKFPSILIPLTNRA
jgi:hypothetical protein